MPVIKADLQKSDIDFVWISYFYDLPLLGLCRLDGCLCEFELTNYYQIDEPGNYAVCSLTLVEKVRWLTRKWMFELCVGTHWSGPDYRDRKYGIRRPKFFWRLIKRIYDQYQKQARIRQQQVLDCQ